MLALSHQIHILITIPYLIPVDDFEYNTKLLHKRFTPIRFIRKYIKYWLINILANVFYSTTIILFITYTIIREIQVVASSYVNAHRIARLHDFRCFNIFLTYAFKVKMFSYYIFNVFEIGWRKPIPHQIRLFRFISLWAILIYTIFM